MLRGHRDLRVFQVAYELAMQIFRESRAFPKDERYSLTDQIRRSSRSVASKYCRRVSKEALPEHVHQQARGLRWRSV
jgi:four helix bundle protein